jgi:predicted RNase H-like HicB family nuclease
MNFNLTAYIEDFNGAGFMGWIEGVKGIAVQGQSEEEVRSELLTSLKVKIAFDFGIKMENLSSEQLSGDQDLLTIDRSQPKRKKENYTLKLQHA